MKNLHIKLIFLLCVASTETNAQTSNCSPPSQSSTLNINNVNAEILNGGDRWWDLVSAARYEVPYSPNETQRGPSSLFAGALWIGGIDQGGQLRVAAATYRQNGNDYFPGPLDANGLATQNGCEGFDKMWKLNKTTIDSFRNQTFPVTQSSIPSNILTWPATNNPFNSNVGNQDLAPFIDVNGDGIYDPTQGDYPDILGDQSVWWVYNDMGNVHGETKGQPLGIQVQEQAFAYKTNDCLNNATFYQYKIIYKGTSELDSTFMGFWVDPDLGCYTDDFIACDSTRNIGISYNASAYDGGNPSACALNYGNQPPFLAIDLLGGTGFPNGGGFGMGRFGYYNNDFSAMGNPQHPSDYYSYLTGSWLDGTPWTYGGNAYGGTVRARYVLTGEPDLPKPAWSECSENDPAGDRRMVMSSGQYRLSPGDVRTIYMGVEWVRPPVGTYPCPSFALLDDAVDCMKANFVNGILPSASAGIPTINQPANETITVFPNPATDNVTMSFSDKQPKQVMLYNMLGVEVKQYSNVQGNTLIIDKEKLAPGIYFYQETNFAGEKTSGKIIFE